MLSVVMLRVVMLSVIMLSVVGLKVIVPSFYSSILPTLDSVSEQREQYGY